MIVLVLSMHAADTYSPFGNWYYVDREPAGLATKIVFGVYQSFLQAFFMALLFLVAGYFSAAAYDRKGFAPFVRDARRASDCQGRAADGAGDDRKLRRLRPHPAQIAAARDRLARFKAHAARCAGSGCLVSRPLTSG